MRLWRVGTNTLYILRAIGSWFVRYMAQPYIYSFQGSDWLILPRTAVRVKAIHPTTDFIGRGFPAKFYKNLKESEVIIIMSANRTEIVNEYSMMTSVYAFWYLQGDYIEYLDRGIFVTVFYLDFFMHFLITPVRAAFHEEETRSPYYG